MLPSIEVYICQYAEYGITYVIDKPVDKPVDKPQDMPQDVLRLTYLDL